METNDTPNKKRVVPTASAILDDGTIVEMVFRPDLRRTLFAIFSVGRWTLQARSISNPTRSWFDTCTRGAGPATI
jgi:hypothetical protein